ncbi:MAG: MFS transporter [Rhodospirillaceae bacterium]|jgi:MFS family permease|nr:MFS transporter [Rhodospirillaceae bacterium]
MNTPPSGSEGFSLTAFWSSVRGHPIRSFLVCLVAVTLSTMDQALFSYAVPGITEEFDVGLDRIGVMLSLSFLVASFSVVIAGILTDFIGRQRMFITMMVLSAFFVGCHALAGTINMLTLFRVLGFAFAAGLYPITATIVIEVAPARYRGMMSAWLQMGYPIGFSIAAMIASGLLEEFGWRGTFYPAFLVIPLAFILGRMFKETDRFEKAAAETGQEQNVQTPTAKRSIWGHVSELFAPHLRARTVICFAGTVCSNIAIAGITFFLPTFLIQGRGISEPEAAGLLAWTWGIAAIGYILASYIGEFVLTRRNTVILWQWLGAICLAVTLWTLESPFVLMVGLGISSMFFFASESMRMPMVGEIFPTRLRATASASVGSLGVTTASLMAPLMVTTAVPLVGWTWTFTILGVVPLALAGYIFTRLENFPTGVEVEELSS